MPDFFKTELTVIFSSSPQNVSNGLGSVDDIETGDSFMFVTIFIPLDDLSSFDLGKLRDITCKKAGYVLSVLLKCIAVMANNSPGQRCVEGSSFLLGHLLFQPWDATGPPSVVPLIWAQEPVCM